MRGLTGGGLFSIGWRVNLFTCSIGTPEALEYGSLALT